MLKKIDLQDGFFRWVDKINLVMDDVDGKFRIETEEIGQTLTLDIAGGTVKIGVADYITVSPATITLPSSSQSVIGVDLTDDTIKSFPFNGTPSTRFLSIYFINTNTTGVSSVQDMRSWATNLDAVTNELLNEVGDQFLGNFASDPTVDNDGDPLIVGAVYYNTTEQVLKFYNGTNWFSPQQIATNAANAASTSASEALTSENNASNSADAAGVSETNASNSAFSALESKDTAISARDEAISAKDQAEAIFQQFGDQYLGPKASDPTTENDGSPLTDGDVYFNTTDEVLKFYTGTTWISPENVATTAAQQASDSADAAAISESNAATSEQNASDSASAALTSEQNASASESNAATSETNASNSASAAATSESNAQTAETNTVNLYDLFDDRFLGAKSSNPTVDNDGNSLVSGAIYFNTTSNDVRFYTGIGWISPQTIATNASDAASNFASNAATSASNASDSETNASISAGAAQSSEDDAAISETNASNSASAALTSEQNADTSEQNAANSASAASTSENNAATSASDALASENKAFLWAEEDQNVEVEPGQFSAKHWAGVAESVAVGQLEYKGNFNASLGSYPSSPTLGDIYKVTTGGTIDGRLLEVNDYIFYNGGTATATSGWNQIKDRNTTYAAGTGITLSGTTFNLTGDSFVQTNTYANLRAQGTTAGDVGLGSVRNVSSYSQAEANAEFLSLEGTDFGGTYPVTFLVNGNIHSNSDITFDGTNNDLAIDQGSITHKTGTEGCKVEYNATSKSLEYNFF